MKLLRMMIKTQIRRLIAVPAVKAAVRKAVTSSRFLAPEYRYRLRGAIEACGREEVIGTQFLGRDFYYPSRSIIGIRLSEFGNWEGDCFAALLDIVAKSARTVIEVGANIGVDTVLIAERMRNARIVVFEPCDTYRRVLEKNVGVAKCGNVQILDYFLSSVSSSEITLFRNSSSASAVDGGSTSFPTIDTQSCRTISLDEFFEKDPSLASLDLLKIDTDGYDQDVVVGARRTIDKYQPYLFVEFAGYLLEKVGRSSMSFARLLDELGYRDFLVIPEASRSPVRVEGSKKLVNSLEPAGSVNVFAIPSSRGLGAFESFVG